MQVDRKTTSFPGGGGGGRMGENPGNEVDGKIGDVYVFSYQSPSFLYCSFFDPDPESSCFGVSHYGGNVSENASDST